jgi:hypothetical protein
MRALRAWRRSDAYPYSLRSMREPMAGRDTHTPLALSCRMLEAQPHLFPEMREPAELLAPRRRGGGRWSIYD